MPEGMTGYIGITRATRFTRSVPSARFCRGFTLIELLMTLALMLLLIGLGVPSLGGLLSRTTLDTQVEQLVSHLQQARTQAILRDTQVLICPVNPQLPDAGCRGGRNDWAEGYALIDQRDGSVLAVQPGGSAVRISSWPTRFVFTPDGSLSSAVGGRFIVCDRNDRTTKDVTPDQALADPKRVVVSGPGRVRIAMDEDLDCDW